MTTTREASAPLTVVPLCANDGAYGAASSPFNVSPYDAISISFTITKNGGSELTTKFQQNDRVSGNQTWTDVEKVDSSGNSAPEEVVMALAGTTERRTIRVRTEGITELRMLCKNDAAAATESVISNVTFIGETAVGNSRRSTANTDI